MEKPVRRRVILLVGHFSALCSITDQSEVNIISCNGLVLVIQYIISQCSSNVNLYRCSCLAFTEASICFCWIKFCERSLTYIVSYRKGFFSYWSVQSIERISHFDLTKYLMQIGPFFLKQTNFWRIVVISIRWWWDSVMTSGRFSVLLSSGWHFLIVSTVECRKASKYLSIVCVSLPTEYKPLTQTQYQGRSEQDIPPFCVAQLSWKLEVCTRLNFLCLSLFGWNCLCFGNYVIISPKETVAKSARRKYFYEQ